ncbi:MAG: tol-pal system protein YbgF [Myxococcota bacterium]
MRSALSLGALFLLCACVTVPEFQSLKRDVDQLKKGKGGAPSADSWGSDRKPSGSASTRLAEQGAEIDALHAEVAELRGEIEALKKQIDQGAASRPPSDAAAAGAAGGEAVAAVPPGTGTETAPIDEGGAPAEEIRDYEDAFRRYRAADYAGAIDRFRVFLQTHPSSEYADNALFWMGDSYFKLNDYEQAAVAFDRVVKRFPEGNKVPDALYRQGVSLLEIGKRTKQQKTYTPAACQIFRRITDEYPNSERVPEARRQLEKCPT